MLERAPEPGNVRQKGANCIMDKRKEANQQVKDRLLDALLEFAGEKDFSQLKVTELVERSGVARASFYRNFDSVEDIVDYGIKRMARLYHEGMPAACARRCTSREAMRYKFRFYPATTPPSCSRSTARTCPPRCSTSSPTARSARAATCRQAPSRASSCTTTRARSTTCSFCWLEGGMRETPEALADEFLRIARGETRT